MTVLDPTLTRAQPLAVNVCIGTAAVMAESSRLAELAAAIPGTPVTARWPWLAASVAKPAATEQPWVIAVTAHEELVAAAVLLDDASGSVLRTNLAGTAEEHRGALLAVDDRSARRLGVALADALMGTMREFTIGPVHQGPAVAALLERLSVGVIVDEVAVPVVHADPGVPIGMSHGVARTLRKAANRMAADRVHSEVTVTGQGREITAMLPMLESISRDRDIAGGRPSPLDDPDRRRLWQRRVLSLAAADVLHLAMLRLNGQLAAYVLGIEDGVSYRVLEGRYVARWARYAPGRVLEAAVLDAAVGSETLTMLDWMTGIAPETLLAANGTDALVVIRGRS
jgi:hypothetical protein